MRTTDPIAMPRFDGHISRRPPDACDDGRLTDAVAQRRREPVDDAVVAVEHATDASLANVAARTAAFGQRAFADPLRVRGLKTLDVLQRELPVGSQSSAARL